MRFGTGHRFGSARGGGGNGGGGGASGISPAVASPLLFLVGDNDLATSGGNVTSWADGGSIGNTYAPGTAPAATTINSRPTPQFDTGSSEYLVSDGAAADYAAFNDTATGFTLYFVLRPNGGAGTSTGYFFDTLGTSPNNTGLEIKLDNRAAVQRVQIYLGNGSGTYVLNGVGAVSNSFPQGTTKLLTLTASNAAGWVLYANNTSIASGSVASTSGTPSNALRIGGANGGAGYSDAQIPYVAGYSSVHNSTNRGLVYAQAQALYGF